MNQDQPVISTCNNCGTDGKCRHRSFSEEAWMVLLFWNEINPSAVNKSICDECYSEMREILMDRTDEIDLALKSDEVNEIRLSVLSLVS